ncbi:MAG: hypothetical protein GXP30_06585 [Verrucomicrobia bacterium]|nr:hypothetical protein [Verrucomicrobiota bacterium]
MDLPYFQLTTAINEYVAPALREGDLDSCIHWADVMLSKVPESPFHLIRELDFTTCPKDTAEKFDRWALEQEKNKLFGSVYTETNGFAFNADQWHFHWFAYGSRPRDQNYDYLGEGWISEDHDLIVLTGMEDLQKSFQSDWVDEEDFARDICECAVVFKLMRFVQSVATRMKHLRYPLVVSSHGWDVFLAISPTPKAEQNVSEQPATRF